MRIAALCCVTLLWAVGSLGAQARDRSEIAISEIELGERGIGANGFRATITNHRDAGVLAVLDLRASPGMWLRRNWQSQFAFALAAHETRSIAASYTFDAMSPEASLRVRLGPGHRTDEGYPAMDSIAFEHRYAIGERNPAALDIERYFEIVRHGLFEIYAWKGSLAAERLGEIVEQRTVAVELVRDVIGVDPPERIRLVFYPDSASKTRQTGHIGAGLAFGTTIVEIYNDEIRLDPVHELAHVLTNQIGEVPAMFAEGFAVYVSERLAYDALRHLGSPGSSVDETVCSLLVEGSVFGLAELSALEEIGSPGSRPGVAYPQSASVVEFLIDSYGEERFRALYRALAAKEGEPADRTAAAFENVLASSVARIDDRWRSAVEARCAQR